MQDKLIAEVEDLIDKRTDVEAFEAERRERAAEHRQAEAARRFRPDPVRIPPRRAGRRGGRR